MLFKEVVRTFDCSVICGHRGKAEQSRVFKYGTSALEFPNSLHNITPARAADVVPYPLDWEDTNRFYFFGGFVLGVAARLYDEGIIDHRIRWGGDWDNDTETRDQSFNDLPHFELAAPRHVYEV